MSNVSHPAHYNTGKIEVIEFIEDKNLGFHLGNAVKYIARAGKKDPSKHQEDLEKAKWYLEREIEVKFSMDVRRPNDMREEKININIEEDDGALRLKEELISDICARPRKERLEIIIEFFKYHLAHIPLNEIEKDLDIISGLVENHEAIKEAKRLEQELEERKELKELSKVYGINWEEEGYEFKTNQGIKEYLYPYISKAILIGAEVNQSEKDIINFVNNLRGTKKQAKYEKTKRSSTGEDL